MDTLWAPWRMTYINGIDKPRDEGCIFCTKPTQTCDRENLILARGKHTFVLMNLYPYNNGHLMVVPYKHTPNLDELTPEICAELWEQVRVSVAILKRAFNAEGFNIGMNLGRAGGAGIDQHVHMHIVPRWNGDTNFMPVVGAVKVISQSLEEAYGILLKHYQG